MLFNLAGFQEAVHQQKVKNDTVRLFVVVFKVHRTRTQW